MTSTSVKKGMRSGLGDGGSDTSCIKMVLQMLMLVATFVWVLAVIKVFVLEGAPLSDTRLAIVPAVPVPPVASVAAGGDKYSITYKTFKKEQPPGNNGNANSAMGGGYVPRASEWLLMRQHQGGNPYNIGSKNGIPTAPDGHGTYSTR